MDALPTGAPCVLWTRFLQFYHARNNDVGPSHTHEIIDFVSTFSLIRLPHPNKSTEVSIRL